MGLILLFALVLCASSEASTLSAGINHTVAVRSDGSAYAWGSDELGQLGRGEVVQAATPQLITGLPRVSTVAAGTSFVLALTDSGEVFAWGDNDSGQLGDGTTVGRFQPARVNGLSEVVAIAAASDVAIAVRRDGSVWTWGDRYSSTIGRDVGVFEDTHTPGQVPNLSGVVSVVTSTYHVLAVGSDGALWSWGSNLDGELGDGTRASRKMPARVAGLQGVVAAAAGGTFSIALRSDGSLWSWGDNASGQLGDGTTTDRIVPGLVAGLPPIRAVAADFSAALAVDTSGSVWTWGSNGYGLLAIGPGSGVSRRAIPERVAGLSGVAEASGGVFHFLARLQSGRVMAWGSNEFGQVGDGTNEDRYGPTDVVGIASAARVYSGDGISFAVLADGRLVGWGINRSGMLGSERTERHSVPRRTLLPVSARAVSGGNDCSLALASDGTVWAWGANADGELGDGTRTARSTPVRVAKLSNMVSVSAGTIISAALGADGRVWAWGFAMAYEVDESGVVLDGLTPARLPGLSDIIAVSAGASHILALKRDGTVWAFGSNSHGELGLGSTVRWASTGQQVPGLSGVATIAAGYSRSFAVGGDGRAWAWGAGKASLGDAATLGNDSTKDQFSPIRIPGLEGVAEIATNSLGSHALALMRDGTVQSWGENRSGQLGDGTTTARGRPVPVNGLSGAVEISAGYGHSAARLAGGGVLAWGTNYNGEVGDGSFSPRKAPRAAAGIDGAILLDLSPGDPSGVPATLVPPFGLESRLRGTESAPIVDASLSFRQADIGTTQNVYVFALAPANRVKAAQSGLPPLEIGKALSQDGRKSDVGCVLAQLNASGQLQAADPATLQAYARGVLSALGQTVPVVPAASATNVAGATFFVGYGTSPGGMLDGGINRSVVSVTGTLECKPSPPQTGWWWNPAESGRGFSLEVRGNNIFFAAFLYDVSGRSTWYVSTGPVSLDGAYYRGDLLSARGGQTLAGAYPGFPALSSVGEMTLVVGDTSLGILTWPGGIVPIQRFNIVPGGLSLAPVAGQPESGWWWNDQEAGRGFFLEWQGGNLDIAGYMYDEQGNSVWYLTTGIIGGTASARSFGGNWWSFGNGQTLTGPWKPNARLSDNVAPVTIQFSSPEAAIMTLPNGRTTALKRHRF